MGYLVSVRQGVRENTKFDDTVILQLIMSSWRFVHLWGLNL